MSYAPATISALGAYWTRQGGVNSGIVGGAGHTRGYHLGKDRIYDGSGPGQGGADYSVQTTRDKAGLTNAASALDLGRLDGTLHNLWQFSKWFVSRCRANAPGTRDVREVIYSPDGETVLRWDRQRGYASAPRRGESDSSHLWHTHISFYRDSESRGKVDLFRPYFETEEDAPMPTITTYIPGQVATVMAADGAKIRSAPTLTADVIRMVAADTSESWTVTGWVKGDLSGGSDQWITRWADGRWEYTHKGNVASVAPPADSTPFDQADIDAAEATGRAHGLDEAEAAVHAIAR